MTEPWSARAQLYRESRAHAEGADLDLVVEWAAGARTAIDVATGGGHVARRLREAGLDVVTCDPAPGMEPDVICFAEDIPFAADSFDLAVTRVAAHHFADPGAAVRELARVAPRVVVVDNLHLGEEVEEAERLRDPSHVRNYSEAEWRAMFTDAGLAVEEVRTFDHPIELEPWLERTACTGETAERVRELLAGRIRGGEIVLDRVALRGRREGLSVDGGAGSARASATPPAGSRPPRESSRQLSTADGKKGAHGGNMVSPVLGLLASRIRGDEIVLDRIALRGRR